MKRFGTEQKRSACVGQRLALHLVLLWALPVSAQPGVASADVGLTRAPVVVVPARPEPAHDYARLRFGMGISGGGFFGDLTGGMGGGFLQLGVQFADPFGIYVQAHGLAGAFANRQRGDVVSFWWNALMFEGTVGDLLSIGVGPSLDLSAGCTADATQAGCADEGPFPGVDGKVALTFGGAGPGSRGAFVIASDLHATVFREGYSLALLVSLGGQAF